MRKTEGGEGGKGNLRLYLRKTRGGRGGSRDVSPKGKRKELEVFIHGPLRISRSSTTMMMIITTMTTTMKWTTMMTQVSQLWGFLDNIKGINDDDNDY